MTTLREAAQQALEALEQDNPSGRTATITLLRAALDEPEQEPVAWMYTGVKSDGTTHGPHLVWKPEYMDAMSASKGAQATPLYTAPPQRKPLTEEELAAIPCTDGPGSDWDALVRFARAVEAAHGIKEMT